MFSLLTLLRCFRLHGCSCLILHTAYWSCVLLPSSRSTISLFKGLPNAHKSRNCESTLHRYVHFLLCWTPIGARRFRRTGLGWSGTVQTPICPNHCPKTCSPCHPLLLRFEHGGGHCFASVCLVSLPLLLLNFAITGESIDSRQRNIMG